jgi:hypothetical protein
VIHGVGGGATHGCCWTHLRNFKSGDFADFRDPFETEVRWLPAKDLGRAPNRGTGNGGEDLPF